MASKTLGAGNWRIILRHLIPNSSGILITTMTIGRQISEVLIKLQKGTKEEELTKDTKT